MNYQTYTPSADLNAFVKCYWALDIAKEAKPEKQRIVPDGCMEMIFHLGAQYRQYLETDTYIIQPKSFVFGQISRPLYIEPTGATKIFAVRFQPDGFTAFSAMPINEMENKAVPLQQLFGEDGLWLEKEISDASTPKEKVKATELFLLKRLTDPESVDRITKSCVEIILRLNGQLPINALSDQLNINRRQLERKFSSLVGLTPKQLCKIARLQSTLKTLVNKDFTNLTSVAYESDYYDQAHFIKDFKEFTGMSPKKFYADNLKLSALFSGGE